MKLKVCMVKSTRRKCKFGKNGGVKKHLVWSEKSVCEKRKKVCEKMKKKSEKKCVKKVSVGKMGPPGVLSKRELL